MSKINVLLISEATLNCFTQDVKLKEKINKIINDYIKPIRTCYFQVIFERDRISREMLFQKNGFDYQSHAVWSLVRC